ncbi:MAG: sialate O-acetylesterase [Bacteroidetes bacterium]|nr:sialate O-acetylesterase [Bacteroidota bacterium]
MKKKIYLFRIILLIPFILIVQIISAQLKLPSFFTDSMVLQQKKVNKIWGWASAGKLVSVDFKGKKYSSFANENGEWQVFVEPQNAGNAGNLNIYTNDDSILLKDILIGEVWICSGQSNMEMTMGTLTDTYQDEINTANNNNLRFVLIKDSYANTAQKNVDVQRKWASINPASIKDCSAVAYWYAKKLFQNLNIPIGIIITSWGGTPAQSWTSFEALHNFPNYSETFQKKIKPLQLNDVDKETKLLYEKYREDLQSKSTYLKEVVKPEFDDSNWEEMNLPKEWEEQGYPLLDGFVVYRLAFNISEADAGKEAVLHLPPVDDMDSTYINGTLIGTTNQWDAFRTYTLPAGILKQGKNILILKVQDDGGGGGLADLPNKFNVTIGSKVVSLSGKAKFKIISVLEDFTGGNGLIERQPTVLFNGMIAPLIPLAIRGVIWYQGESNTDSPIEYRSLFPAMITDWRNRWGQGDFPFLYVQLPSFGALTNLPSESNWALLREAQLKTLSLPNTAMAVTIDIGQPDNLHPHNKKAVGERLADCAMKLEYKQKNAIRPETVFTGFYKRSNQIVLQFNCTNNDLKSKGPILKYFTIAGKDKKFIWADAVISGNRVIVSSKFIKNPVAVRYAWADSPLDANLYNKEGYPVSPFRTDDW